MYIFVYVIFDWPYLSKHLVQQKCKQLIFLWAAVYTHIFYHFFLPMVILITICIYMYVYVSSSSISFKKHLRHLFVITISILGNSMIC